MKNAETSQLIDIAAMAALVKPQARTSAPPLPPARTDLLSETAPSFGVSRLVTRTTAPVSAHAATTRDPRTPLYWLIGALNVAVLGLAAFVVLEKPTVIVQPADAEPAVAAPMAIADERNDEQPVDEHADIPGAPKLPEIAAPTEPEAKVGKRGKAKTPKTKPVIAAKDPDFAKTPTKPTPSKDVPFECIVDPASCDRGSKAPEKETEAQGPRAKIPAEDLPETLSQSALRNGFGKVRTDAKACGSKFGAAPGENVAVKVSIAGASGVVTSSSALDAHAGTPLGKCVAAALKNATFDRFAKSTIGIKYTVRL